MDFIDKTLIKLAAPEARGALFDDTALAQLLAATYDLEGTPIEGPFQPVFDEIRLGLALSSIGEIDGAWNVMGTPERTEAKFYLSGVKDTVPLRVDGYWRGHIQARAAAATARVTDARIAWPEFLSIDAEITSQLGSLPSDPAVLEEERSKRLLERIRAHVDQPAAFTEATLRTWIIHQRAGSVGELLGRGQAGLRVGTIQIGFSPAESGEPTSKSLPLAGLFLIRDAGFSVAQLLMESRLARVGLKPMGLERSPQPPLKSRESLIVIWMVPETVFDDPDWPGGNPGMTPAALRTARRNEAGQWLAREGIGLVAAPA
ncbi:MAG TPA: hypothetical protein VKB50_20525 [Vicinamibacterales bacterium]|nr:hypothetical protein [Vicinamibacterales bacterium]